MTKLNNFQQLLAEDERRFEDSGVAEELQRKIESRFAFLRLAGDLTELFTNRMFDVAIMMSSDSTEPGRHFRSEVLEDLKAAVEEMLERDIDATIAKLESLLHNDSQKYEELLSVKKQLSNLSSERIMIESERGEISQRLQNLIDSLDQRDFR
jgi:hypothetical protein